MQNIHPRQPFAAPTWRHFNRLRLASPCPGRPVKLSRGRGSDQRLRSRSHRDLDIEPIATNDAAGRVQQIGMANRSLGMKGPLNTQWAGVISMPENGLATHIRLKAQPQRSGPAESRIRHFERVTL